MVIMTGSAIGKEINIPAPPSASAPAPPLPPPIIPSTPPPAPEASPAPQYTSPPPEPMLTEKTTEKKQKREKPVKPKREKSDILSEENSLSTKKWAIAGTYIAAVIIILVIAVTTVQSQQKEIQVIRVTRNLTAGAMIISDYIESFPMLKNTYDALGSVTYTNDGGDRVQKFSMVLWENRGEIVGKYASNYIQAGQLLSELNVTDRTIIKNPWLERANDGDEVYTMPFRVSDINLNLLYVGTPLRVRAVMKNSGGTAESNTSSGIGSVIDNDNDIIGAGSVSNIPAAFSGAADDISVHVIFEELIAVDMLNSKGESIFELYMDLLSKPIEERARHLETRIEREQTTFKEKVTPVSLVFLLTKEQASEFAKFEAAQDKYTLKYTILARRDDDGELINSFLEINKELQELMSDMNVLRD
jgi:hypothetical protein